MGGFVGYVFLQKKLDPESYFKNLVGLESEVVKVKGFCEFAWSQDWLVHSKLLRFMPTILLYGPPGTGKTTLLRNLACDIGDKTVEYFRENLDLLAHKDLGETSKAVESLFSTIKERASCGKKVLLQMDDVDSLLSSRHQINESSGVKRAVNTFITQLDDLMLERFTFPPIIVATTNMLDHLDIAIKRRFSLKVEVNPKLTEAQLKELVSPLVELCGAGVEPDYSVLTSVAKKNNLTPNDIIRALQGLYLLSRGGTPPSDGDFLSAFNKADSSIGNDGFENRCVNNQASSL